MPTSHYKRRQTVLACACLSSLAAGAADLRFTTIISDQNANIAFPNLPASYTIASGSAAISDVGSADMAVFLTSAAAGNGHWAQVEGSWRQFAAINTSNAAGPGRTGAESGHVFFEWDGVSDSAGSNIRTFIGRAGSPLQPSSVATWGVYAFNGLANVEVARGGNVGALGPNLATGWQFNTSGNPFGRIIPQANGRVVISAQVDSPNNAFIPAVVLHVPGFGNRGCAAIGLTGSLAPGVGLTFNELRWVVAASDGPVYVRGTQVNGSFVTAEGIWAICEGAPSVKALAKVTGVRGPGLAASTAIFNVMQNLITTAGGDSFYFGASGQETAGAGAVPFDGIFRHDGTANAPVALRSVQVAGPQSPWFRVQPIWHDQSTGRRQFRPAACNGKRRGDAKRFARGLVAHHSRIQCATDRARECDRQPCTIRHTALGEFSKRGHFCQWRRAHDCDHRTDCRWRPKTWALAFATKPRARIDDGRWRPGHAHHSIWAAAGSDYRY